MFDILTKDYNKCAIRYAGQSYSYKELLQNSQLYANLFTASCDEKVERVMFFSPNSPDLIFAIYGALRVGAITIPVDAMSTERELGYMINDSRPQIIYTTDEGVERVESSIKAIDDSAYTPCVIISERVNREGVKILPAEAILPGKADDIMTIIYTSGTTGSPKGVMLTYANLWYNVDAVSNQVPIFNINTRILQILPSHHIFAFVGSIIAPIYKGGEVHIVENLNPETIVKTLQDGRCTLILGVPRLYEALAKGIMTKINSNLIAKMLYKLCSTVGSDSFSRKIFKSVHEKFGGAMEYFVSGGAALPIETGNVFKNLGLYVLEGYGMTECAPMIAFTRPGERAVGYCGRMLPGCEYKIEPTGELCVRGTNMMKGYYNREEETAQVIRNGWLHTGDTAVYHEKYGIQITGRIKEIIVTPNGKNINPASIENEITQSSKAIKEIGVLLYDDILQAIVYPDMAVIQADTQRTMDEMIRAEIEEYNREAMGYKRIMRYQITSQELPKTRLSKIQRFKLPALMESREEVVKEDISDRSERYKLLKSFVDDQTGLYANGDSHFEIDLALDSLGRVSLLSYIEESFGVQITETQLGELSTLNLLSAYVEERSESVTLKDGEVSWDEILKSGSHEVALPKSGFIHWFVHIFMWLFFTIFYRFSQRGVKGIPQGPVLFVANHRSGFDGVFVTSHLSWKVVHNTLFFAKDKHFQGGFKEFMARKNNVILMNINSNVRESMQQMYAVLSHGRNIMIFPEGTRSRDGVTRSFKESFAILSQALNIPVVPVAIKGSEGATYDAIRLPRLWQQIGVEFLPAMISKEGESTAEFAKRVEESIVDAL